MNILIASDGSKHAEAALDFLTRLPLPENSKITLLVVVEKPRPLFAGEHPIIGKQVGEAFQEYRRALQQGARRVLEREERRLRDRGFVVRTACREGHAADEIVEACCEVKPDLLVLGSRGLGGFKGLLLGSVSRQLLRHAPCSVLIVKSSDESHRESAAALPAARESGRLSFLVAFDGSPHAKAAVQMMKSLPLGERAAVTVLTVVPELSRHGLDSAAIRLLSEVWQAEKEAAQAAAEEAARQIACAASHVSALSRDGDPSLQIVHVADETDADLIVIGARGKSAVERFFLGSVSSYVGLHAPCSVWIVRT